MNKFFVFVLMPFSKEFDDTYNLGIKAATSEVGMYCERVDEQVFEERILDRIYNQINKADYIIADMSGRNPNVFYEVGYAHALNKKVILVVNDVNDIPFDLRHHSHIIYNQSIVTLKTELIRKLSWYIANPDITTLPNPTAIACFIDGQLVAEGCKINVKYSLYDQMKNQYLPLKIDIHNTTDLAYTQKFQIAFQVPKSRLGATHSFKEKSVEPNPETVMLLSDKIKVLMPKAWLPVTFYFSVGDKEYREWFDVKLKLFTPSSVAETSFHIKYQAEDWGSF